MECIPKGLANEITDKYNLLVGPKCNDYSFLVSKKRIIKMIKTNAECNSYSIEHPSLSMISEISEPKKRKLVKQGVKNLQDAFRWGEAHFNFDSFGEEYVRKLAARVEPEIHSNKDIADYSHIVARFDRTTAYPEKIREEMFNFVNELKKHFQSNNTPIERMGSTLYAHFNLVRIHPFYDGNGRTARILQNIILDKYNFPLPIIESGERYTYNNLIKQAVEGYYDRKSEKLMNGLSNEEKNFYTYLAGKVNSSLDKVLENLC
jgi:Fic family protein